jgi:hypothetical protein
LLSVELTVDDDAVVGFLFPTYSASERTLRFLTDDDDDDD